MRLAYLRVVVRLWRACSLAPVCAGCTADARELLYTIQFACENDRDLSDELLLRVRAGGCLGERTLYEAHLSKGEQAPLGGVMPPGAYGFEAVAYREGAVLASECLEADLPRTGPPVVVLQSDSCAGEAGAGPADAAPADVGCDGACLAHCQDGGSCDEPDACDAGACANCETALDCDDDNPCTSERCEGGRCHVEASALACDDGKSCTAHDVCANLACTGADVCPSGTTCGPSGCACEAAAETLCDASCVNLSTSALHCGACGRACPSGASCENGACKASTASSCTASRFGVHDYLVCTDRLSWQSARERCRGYGLGLAIIEDAGENEFLRAQIGADERWIGATDRGDNGSFCTRSASEGAWYWANPYNSLDDHYRPLCGRTNGMPVSCSAVAGAYQNWREGDPNNFGCFYCNPTCPAGQDCAALLSTGEWNDYDCGTAVGFVCETP